MMFPFVDNEEDDEKEENLYIPREYGINFETGQLSGKIVEGYDALLVWVWLALKTPRYRCYIYSEDYGQLLKRTDRFRTGTDDRGVPDRKSVHNGN